MTIHELLQAAGLTANDEIPIWDVDGTGEPTKKITAQQLATAVVALTNLVKTVTATTDANGNISLDLNRQSYVVTVVKVLGYIATPWASGSDNNWHARITGINGGAYASQSVTATVYYRPV